MTFQVHKSILLKLTLVVAFLTSVGGIALAQDSEEKSEEEVRNEMMQEGLKEAVKEVLAIEYNLLVDESVSFFQLDDSTETKLRILAKGIVAKQMKKLTDDRLLQAVGQAQQNIVPNETFSINNKEYTLPGSERVEPFVRISICIVNSWVWMESKSQNQSMGTSLVSPGRINPASDKSWKKLVEENSDVDLESYKEFLDVRMKERVADLMTALASDALKISDSQLEPLKKWMTERVKIQSSSSVLQNAKNSLQKLEDVPTDILTESQVRSWRLMVAELVVR